MQSKTSQRIRPLLLLGLLCTLNLVRAGETPPAAQPVQTKTPAQIAHQLPKKTDKVVFCPLTELQRAAYERFLESDIVEVVKESSEYCDCDSGKKKGWCCYSHMPDSDTKWQASPQIRRKTALIRDRHLCFLLL